MNETVHNAFLLAYEKAIEELPEDFYEAYSYCFHKGIKSSVGSVFFKSIIKDTYKPPSRAETRDEILKSIQYSLEFMREKVKEYEK